MKLEKDAVTVLGFIGIFLLLVLIFVPPLFRFLFNDDVTGANTIVVEKLSCEKTEKFDNYDMTTVIDTVYTNKKVSKITFNYNVVFTKSGVSGSDVYIENYEMLKQITNAEVKDEFNNYKVIFDFTKHNFSNNSFLSKYNSSMSEQKIFYSNNGFKCNVLK